MEPAPAPSALYAARECVRLGVCELIGLPTSLSPPVIAGYFNCPQENLMPDVRLTAQASYGRRPTNLANLCGRWLNFTRCLREIHPGVKVLIFDLTF